MAESELEAIKQTNQVKDRIDNKYKALPQPERLTASHESLVTFQDLGGSSISGSAVGV